MTIILTEPTDEKGNCGSCGKPLARGYRRYLYNLCNACLKPNGQQAAQDAASAARSRSYKAKSKKR